MRGLALGACAFWIWGCGSGGGTLPDGRPDAGSIDAAGPDALADALPDADIPPGCGNLIVDPGEDCDDGRNGDDLDGCKDDCTFTCGSQLDCDDLSVCTGFEQCTVDHTCEAGVPLDCADTSDCTADSCDAVAGCSNQLIDGDGDGYAPSSIASCGTDCNDGSAAIHPGATELAGDGVDQDCNGGELCFVDADGDGYRLATTVISADADCTDPGEAPATAPTGDCDDASAAVHPGATEVIGDGVDENCDAVEVCYADTDNDGYRTTATIASADLDCTDPGEAVASDPTGDCDDANAGIHPGATELIGDSVDENCDGGETCYRDNDNDGYRTGGTIASTDTDCNDSGEAVASDPAGDCADGNAAINPGASELPGDSVDQNCDGSEVCYTDTDNDGYRTNATTVSADADCNDLGEGSIADPGGDCNDGAVAINPGATEVTGDGTDQNCDGQELCYTDFDDDGYRTTGDIVSVDPDCADSGEAYASEPAGDCADGAPWINPGEAEITGDSADENCDGIEVCFVDADDDGYRLTATVVSSDIDCFGTGEGSTFDPTGDCDDGNAAINPAAAEVTGDSIDENCDGTEVCFVDADDDGWRTTSTIASADADCFDPGEAAATDPTGDCADSAPAVNPGAAEVCFNGADDNCSGTQDEAPECSIDCDWSGARWLSHGWDSGFPGYFDDVGAYLTCTGGKLAFIHWVNLVGTGVNPTAAGTADPIVGCNWGSPTTRWMSQGYDGSNAFQYGATATCNAAGRVTTMNWALNNVPPGPTMSGQLGCDWTGAIFLSHGIDSPCQFQTGMNITCNAGHITNMEYVSTGACPSVRF